MMVKKGRHNSIADPNILKLIEANMIPFSNEKFPNPSLKVLDSTPDTRSIGQEISNDY